MVGRAYGAADEASNVDTFPVAAYVNDAYIDDFFFDDQVGGESRGHESHAGCGGQQ
jgi:hypothetical protein